MFGNCGVTNQVAGSGNAAMTCWGEGGFFLCRRQGVEEKLKKHWRPHVVTSLKISGGRGIQKQSTAMCCGVWGILVCMNVTSVGAT